MRKLFVKIVLKIAQDITRVVLRLRTPRKTKHKWWVT